MLLAVTTATRQSLWRLKLRREQAVANAKREKMSIPGTAARNIDESKVYRNVFTAEIGLLNSLSKERISRSSKTAPLIPVAKDDGERFDTGILTRRQKLWTRARPNEGDIENPVLTKLQKQIKAKKTAKSASYFAAQEVRGLSSDALENDVQEPTGILERIQTNRKGRHEAVLEEMFQELSIINSELEPQINEACSTVKEYLEQDQEEIIRELKVLDKDEDLINFTLKDLNALWVKLGHHTLLRQSWIDELDLTLGAIETDRASLIEDVFKECTQKLVRIAHLMPTDVHKLMEDECLDTNKTLLANKRYCADLIRRLKMSDIERERRQYLRWKTRLDDWKDLKTATAIKGFSSFMTSPAIADPPSVQRQMDCLTTEQKKLNERRLELLRHLREMKPPTSTKTAVYQWHNSLTAITEQLDETHTKYKGILSAAFEKIIYDCDEELTRVKAMLFNEGVRSEEDIEQLTTEQLAPLIGEKRARFEYELEKYEKYTDEITATQKLQFRMLFKYLQGAAHIWDQHELGLTREERELQERLDKNRKEHDTQNQIKEAKFDIVMDRLRQDASEETLAQSLKQSLEMLEEIKKTYHDFHGLQIKTAKQYPSLVEREIKRYDDSVCACFGVSKKKPKIKPRETIDEEQSSREQLSQTSREQLSKGSRDQVNQSSQEQLPQSSQEQLFQISGGQLSLTSREQLPQSSHERLPQFSHEEIPQTSRGQLSQTSLDQFPHSSHERSPQRSHEQLPQTSRDQLHQTSREQLSHSSRDQLPQSSLGQLPQTSREQLPHSRRDQLPQSSHEQLPQTSREQLSHSSREQLPQSSEEQVLQTSRGQLSQTSREQLSHSSREQLSQKSSRGGKKFSELTFDVLELSTGAIYYIIKDTDETTIPPDTTATVRTSYTFLTDDPDEVEVIPYVASFEISQDLIQQTKDHIRKEFLEHLESWKTDALQRAERVMTAKIEELHNELDLRLHLHEPRSGRAEKDVHNVRAAELVMHRDRVTQHCHGILASLSTFKSRFAAMIEDHDNETEKFKNSVESLENTFVSATKSHQLLSIKDEVSNQLEQYMKVIRASLRKFRQDLDEMLNNLRNSNARFRSMLKIFSEGGNFCPEEVEEYRKKLENMASKIDNAEGSMMAELEGMETKRLDAGHEYSGKLEERFKHHLFDLTFLEKTARWLTNTQVKIKSEVANSNTQSQKIAKMIATFDRRIDAVLRPNLDREQINASELHETLMPMLEAFHVQVRYLDCAASEGVSPTLVELYATASKAETKQEEVKLTGKRSRKHKGSESSVGKPSKSKLATTSKSSVRRIENDQRPITVPAQKSPSKVSLTKAPSDPDGEKLGKVRSDSENRQSSVLKVSSSKYDKKYLAFGDGSEEYTNQFMKHITDICKDGLDGLLITSDMYYRQKGNRVATRTSAIHDTFDMCAESLINRVRSYKRQAKDYRNTCMQELRAQVETFGKSLVKFPPLIVDFTFKQHLAVHRKAQTSCKKAFAAKIAVLETQKRNNQTLLRPTLGHPNNRSELEKLTENENTRKMNLKSLVEKHTEASKNIERSYGKNFVDALNELTEKLLRQFDACLTVDDIQRGKVQPQPKSEKQLLREKMMSGIPDKPNDDEKEAVEEQWKTLSTDEFTEKNADSVTTEPATILTRKVTPAHRAVIEARDKAYEQCCSIFKSGMDDIEEEAKKMQQDEVRWTENWNKSINKILDLY